MANMPTNSDLVLWAFATVAELVAAAILLVWGMAREFRFLTGYLVFTAAANVTTYAVWKGHGLSSLEYYDLYYVAHVLGTTILYASVGELALRTAKPEWLAKHVVGLFLAGLCATVLLSSRETPLRFFPATSEKLFWLGGAVVLVLCIWSFWQAEDVSGKRQAAFRLAKVMGVYFALHAMAYGLFYLTQVRESILGGLASAWLPIGASLAVLSAPQSG
jgi:hypothetical protein